MAVHFPGYHHVSNTAAGVQLSIRYAAVPPTPARYRQHDYDRRLVPLLASDEVKTKADPAFVIQREQETFRPLGLPDGVIKPTYGLAEHTVFVCSGGVQRITVDRKALEVDKQVNYTNTRNPRRRPIRDPNSKRGKHSKYVS